MYCTWQLFNTSAEQTILIDDLKGLKHANSNELLMNIASNRRALTLPRAACFHFGGSMNFLLNFNSNRANQPNYTYLYISNGVQELFL